MNGINASPIRKGFTLIELMLVLALTSTLLGGTIGLMSVARESNQQAKQNLFHRQEIRRFADDIRRDVRGAERSDLGDRELVLFNASSDRKISYRVESESTVSRRVVGKNDASQSIDNYALGSDSTIEVQWLDDISAVQWTITAIDGLDQPIQIMAAQRSTK